MPGKKNKTRRRGVALIVVLLIIMAITVLSMGFLSRSDVELACGENMILKTQMDYLAESALEHAKGLILNPQDVASEYWTGATGQQLVAGSDDFYDVNVVKLGQCNYQITCDAYREKAGEKIGRSDLQAELRLDPYIAYWQEGKNIRANITINGDSYCGDQLNNYGTLNGDVYGATTITNISPGSIIGQVNEFATAPLSLPGLSTADFSSQYYYDGSGPYSVQLLPFDTYDNNSVFFPGPGVNNPASVYYFDGSLHLKGPISINGTLVVKDDLTLDESANITVIPVKNMPALIVGHDLKIASDDNHLTVRGYAQVGHHLDMANKTGSSVNIYGALFIIGTDIKNTDNITVTITPSLGEAALEIWTSSTNVKRWSPAAGAFFKGIERQ